MSFFSPENRKAWLPVVLAALGMGCYLGWGMMASSASLLSPGIRESVGALAIGDGPTRWLWLAIVAATGTGAQLLKERFPRRAVTVAAAVLTAGATVGIYLVAPHAEPLVSTLRMPIAASSVFILLWGEQLCRLGSLQALRCVLIASFTASAVVMLATCLPELGQVMLHGSLPVASGGALVWLNRRKLLEPVQGRAFGARRFPLRAFVGIGLLCVVVLLLQTYSEGKTDSPDELLWVVAGLAVNAVLFVASVVNPKLTTASNISKLMLPLFAVGTFLVFATDFGQQSVEVFAIGCAWVYYRIFTWIIWRLGALGTDKAPVAVIAVGQAILTGGSMLGEWAYGLMGAWDLSFFAAAAAVCLLSVCVTMFFLDTRYVAELADETVTFDPENRAVCELCADNATATYGLSRQERSIALMLVRGDDNETIQGELVIATNTLRTHLRNMYRKTDTHSREELVLLLRSLTQN